MLVLFQYIPVIIAISTGMRRGEILGLAWYNVNLEQKYIVVCQALYPTKKGLLLLPPKTDKSNRKISIPDTLVNILLNHKTEQEKHKSLLKNNYNNKDFVCCKENGEPINPSILNHKFANILKINNLPKIRFHDLRHSHASLLLSKGVPTKLISERLGHSNVAITNDLYSHIYDADKQEVANIFDSFIK
jgi:integrase